MLKIKFYGVIKQKTKDKERKKETRIDYKIRIVKDIK